MPDKGRRFCRRLSMDGDVRLAVVNWKAEGRFDERRAPRDVVGHKGWFLMAWGGVMQWIN